MLEACTEAETYLKEAKDDEDVEADDIKEKKKDLESICDPIIKKHSKDEDIDYDKILDDL